MNAKADRLSSASGAGRADPSPDPGAPGPASFSVPTSHGDIALWQSSERGLPVLFLHDMASSKAVFAGELHSGLGTRYRLIGLDFPGHGASVDAPDPAASYSILGYADAVVEVMDALGVDQVVLVGWALGGHVALQLMAGFPGVIGVLLTGAAPLGRGLPALPEPFGPRFEASVDGLDPITETEAATLAGGSPEALTAARRTDPRALALMAKSIIAGDYEDEGRIVATSDVPVAIVVGADDQGLDPDHLRDLPWASLWRGTCHVLPHAGHAAFLDAAPVFHSLLASFLHDMERRASDRADKPTLWYGG